MTTEHVPKFFRQRWVLPTIALALVLVAIAIHAPGLGGGFIFDDRPTIVENPRLHIQTLDATSLKQAAGSFEPGSGLQTRALSMASFGANHALHGLRPWGYKAAGIAVHAVNSVLILLLAYRLLGLAWPHRKPTWAATAVAAAWAAHPLQVSTVLYVVQRMETLSLLFVLAALLCYVLGRLRQSDGRRAWPWLAACPPLIGLGLAAKETAILFPAYALAIELTLLRFAAASATTERAWKIAYAAGTAVALVAFFAVIVPRTWTPADPVVRGFGSADRLLTQLRILPMYLGQMVWPLPSTMPFYYDQISPSRGWLQPATTLAGAGLLAALVASAIFLRQRLPLYSLGIALFFAGHALTSNIVPLEMAFEHRNYFALFGILLAIAALFAVLPPHEHPTYKRFAVAAAIALCAFFAFLRASVWGDPLMLATENVTINSASSRASVDLAAEYLEMTDGYPGSPFNDFAIREFERGSLIPGASIVSDQGLILAAAHAGRPVDPVWWDRLLRKLEDGTISPETTHAMFGLLRNRLNGVTLDDDRLIAAFVAMFNRVSMPAFSYAQVGQYVLDHTGDELLADQLFVQTVAASKQDPGYARRVVTQLRSDGHVRQAQAALRKAHEIGILLDLPIATGEAPESPLGVGTAPTTHD